MPEFFVAYETEPTKWRHVRDNGGDKATFTATTSDDAAGLAAIQEGANGKYLALDVASEDLDVNQITVQLAADATNTTLNA